MWGGAKTAPHSGMGAQPAGNAAARLLSKSLSHDRYSPVSIKLQSFFNIEDGN